VRDTTSRWGSCNTSGALSFSWRLIFAPRDVFDYVVAHEVAHLAQMNHSPRFWSVVAELAPHHEQAREWLNRYGHRLYQFN
jgi:predicted metal-dependent hydrolase